MVWRFNDALQEKSYVLYGKTGAVCFLECMREKVTLKIPGGAAQ
jgi:hypothetical protein